MNTVGPVRAAQSEGIAMQISTVKDAIDFVTSNYITNPEVDSAEAWLVAMVMAVSRPDLVEAFLQEAGSRDAADPGGDEREAAVAEMKIMLSRIPPA